MRIFTATLMTETNTFSTMPTGLKAFESIGVLHGRDGKLPKGPLTDAMLLWGALAQRDGHEIVHSLATFAPPAGRTVRSVYEAFRDEILDDFAGGEPFDLVLLNLHGAMAAEGYDDCEGDLIRRLRDLSKNPVKIGAVLDLHCHLTDEMISQADLLITYKEYPHTDPLDRAQELYDLLLAVAEGKITPTMAAANLPIVNFWATGAQPMRGFVDRMTALERRDAVLSVSFAHGFPWGDVSPGVARTLVVTDDDPELASRMAHDLTQELWGMRREVAFQGTTIDEALDAVGCGEGLIVIADTADNTGGGAPGDSTFVLARAIERGVRDLALGPLWDPTAAQICHDAGLGAIIDLRVGGKTGPTSGDPLDLRVTVRGLADNLRQTVPHGAGQTISMGPSAWIEVDGVHIVLCSVRMQTYAPDLFTNIGLPLEAMRFAVVKSTNHFRAGFDRIAVRTIFLLGPGAIAGDFENFSYLKRTNLFWPKVGQIGPEFT